MQTIAERIKAGDPDARALIYAKLLADDAWVKRALLALHARQTAAEQQAQTTIEDNGRGFNGADSQLLSSFAEQLKSRGWLSSKQMGIARRRLLKYTGQLARIARGEL